MHIFRSSRLARAAAALLLFVAPVGAVVLVAPAGPASAVPCDPTINPNCDPPPPVVTYHAVLTISPPSVGTVIGQDTTSNAIVFTCSTSGGVCSHTDSQATSDGRPVDGWPTYHFAYDPSPTTGYAVTWSGACSGTTSCDVTNSAPTTSLSATSHDVQAPHVAPTSSTGSRASAATVFSANASDNAGIASYAWSICPSGQPCGATQGTQPTFQLPGTLAAGSYEVKVTVTDTSGNLAFASDFVSYVTSVDMTSSDVPAYAQHPSFTFSSTNEEAHVPADDAHRRCRSVPLGGPSTAWGPCTTPNSFAPTLADGSYTLQAEEIDDLGLIGVVSHDVVVDATAPIVQFTGGPADGATITTPNATYPVSAQDANLGSLTCTMDGKAIACPGEIAFQTDHDGTFVIAATAVDKAGSTTTATRTVTVRVPTTVTPTTTTVHSVYGHAAPLAVTVGPAGTTGTVRFISGGHLLCTATVTSGKATCHAPASLGSGSHSVTASYAGNFASSTGSLRLVIAKAATAVRLSLPRSVRHGRTATARVTGLPISTTGAVIITRAGHRLCTARVQRGAAQCRFAAPAKKGTYTLTAAYRGDANHAGSRTTARLRVS